MSLLADLRELLLPRTCCVCGERLLPEEMEICSSCSICLPRIVGGGHDAAKRIWPVAKIVSSRVMFYYNKNSIYKKIIYQVKSPYGKSFCHYMGRWAVKEMLQRGDLPEVDVLIPVPASSKNLKRRGYNQSFAIAEGMSKEMGGIPILDCLVRKVDNKTQKSMNLEERKAYAKNSFKVSMPHEYMGKRILLVDDIMTTGSTLSSCANVILKADPEARIYVFALAQET